jgi:hypothetical protein
MNKTVYTFWESKGKIPAYLDLCMQTWKKNVPGIEIVVINHANWAEFVGDIYDLNKLKEFSLPMQSDAVSAAVLATRGGMFIDMDSIVTKDFFNDFGELAPRKFVAFGKPNTKGMHIAVLKCETPGNEVARNWMQGAKQRIANKAESFNWAYLGNDILHPILNDKKYFDDYLIIDRADYGNILEASLMKEGNPQADYYNFYFNEYVNIDATTAINAAKYGIISLHNSWTPPHYKQLTSPEEVYAENCLLSRILKKIIIE